MKRLPQFHPFAAGAYLVLALAAENRESLVMLPELVATLLICLVVTGAFWLLTFTFMREPHRRGLIALWGVVLFNAYARLRIEVSVWVPSAAREHGIALMVWVLVFGLGTVGILWMCDRISRKGGGGTLPGISRFLNAATLILVMLPTVALVTRPAVAAGPAITDRTAGQLDPLVANLPAERISDRIRRDVYLIVLDKYSGQEALQENYGFDNMPFLTKLEAEGFFVPQAPKANYVHTLMALPALLNWTYLDSLANEVGRDSRNRQPAYDLAEHNRAVRVFRQLGYRFVFVPTSFAATRRNVHADFSMPLATRSGLVLRTAWLRSTPVPAFLPWYCRLTECTALKTPYEIESSARMRWKLREIALLPEREAQDQPVFVFAHLLLPHEPYLFRADCSSREPFWPSTDQGAMDEIVKVAYIEQIQCVNAMILDLVHKLKQRSKDPPIILLQADHGHGRIFGELGAVPYAELSDSKIRERASLFAAYYLPPPNRSYRPDVHGEPESSTGAVVTQPYDSISPVNLLPIVFNRYFGMTIPLKPDITFWSEPDRHYDFFRIHR